MGSGIKIEDGFIQLDIDYFFEAMDNEQQKDFIKRFSIDSNVIEHVVKYLCGEDPDGWWTSQDDEIRMKILTRIEDAQLKDWSKYNWNFIREAESRLKEIKEKKHIYWAIYHGFQKENDYHFSKELHDWMGRHGLVGEYTTKQAEDECQKVFDIVKEAMEKLSDSKK